MYVSQGVLEQRDLRPVSHREYFNFLRNENWARRDVLLTLQKPLIFDSYNNKI